MEQLVHSDLGASSTERWFNCPGSIALCKDIPEPPSGSYADEGSCAHHVVAECLKTNTQAWFYVGENFFGHDVTEEMADHCQTYLDYIESRMAAIGKASELKVEQRLKISGFNNELWGTTDAALLEYLGLLEVVDFKFGRGIVVEAKGNTQGLYYGLGAFEEYDKDFGFSKVRITIVQPRAKHPDGIIRSWDVSPEYVDNFKLLLKDKVQATKQPDAKLAIGDYCRFCRGASVCPELNKKIQKITKVQFTDLTKGTPEISIDPKDISRCMKAIPVIKGWIEAVQHAALSLAEKKIDIPGFKLIRGRKNRAWVDKDLVEKYLIDNKIIAEKIYRHTLKTPKQILDATPPKLHKYLNSQIEIPIGPLQIVPDVDARETVPFEINPNVKFAALPESPALVNEEKLTTKCFTGKEDMSFEDDPPKEINPNRKFPKSIKGKTTKVLPKKKRGRPKLGTREVIITTPTKKKPVKKELKKIHKTPAKVKRIKKAIGKKGRKK